MRLGERARDLPEDVEDAPLGLRAAPGHEVVERDALDGLHGVVEDAVLVASAVVHRDRVRVREPARGPRLALEARDRLARRGRGADELHRRRPPEEPVPRPVDGAHPALADLRR